MSVDVVIREAVRDDLPGLVGVLVDCVDGGASVGFMAPLSGHRAEAFWSGIFEHAAAGGRVVFVAEEPTSGTIVGTAQVVLDAPENQPHRGEIAKMLVHRSARRRGIADALMDAAEDAAVAAGKELLVLDTASDSAERLYERRGWVRAGVIPGYALWPGGGFCDTVLFYKQLVASG